LGSLYLATGKEMSGLAQLKLRVRNRAPPGKSRRRMNGTIEKVWWKKVMILILIVILLR